MSDRAPPGVSPEVARGLKPRLDAVEAAIAEACRAAGRARADVTLVAVSKEQPAESVAAMIQLGLVDFGENKLQAYADRLRDFAPETLPDLRWHLIGPLQSNKARDVARRPPALLHTLDRPELVTALAKRLDAREGPDAAPLPCLVQVDVDREPTKAGVDPDDLAALVDLVAATPSLSFRGLMAIPRPGDPRSLRAAFARLRALADTVADRLDRVDPAERHPILSMGMSDDFALAIAEGATHVRVGSALFGARPSKAPANPST